MRDAEQGGVYGEDSKNTGQNITKNARVSEKDTNNSSIARRCI